MDRVQSLPQFISWLKERAQKHKQERSEPSLPKTCPPHSPKCKCRSCMKLPQLPREQRRQQKMIAERDQADHESPEHVYEEIPPELVSHVHKDNQSDGHVGLKDNQSQSISMKQGHGKDCSVKQSAPVMRYTDPSQTFYTPQQALDCAIYQNEIPESKDSFKRLPPVGSNDNSQQDVQNQSQGVNLGNLDFEQAKEFGGFLVVPMRDRMVFQPVNVEQQPGQTEIQDSENIVKSQENTRLSPGNDSKENGMTMLKEALSHHLEVQDSHSKEGTNMNTSPTPANSAFIPQTQDSIQGNSERKSAFTKYIPSSQSQKLPTANHKSKLPGSTSAFRIVPSYDHRKRDSICTESSGDSGGYFPNDITMTSQKSSSYSLGSNDTYSEYDIKSDSSTRSAEYGISLEKVQQARLLEENVQQILRESESENEYTSSSSENKTVISNDSMSPISMLDIDEILTLVSSDDNSQLISDILFDNEQVVQQTLEKAKLNHNILKSRVKQQHRSKQPTHMDDSKSRQQNKLSKKQAFVRHTENVERLSCRATAYKEVPIKKAADMSSKKCVVPVNTKQCCAPGTRNRLLSDLMRQNHDRQLFL